MLIVCDVKISDIEEVSKFFSLYNQLPDRARLTQYKHICDINGLNCPIPKDMLNRMGSLEILQVDEYYRLALNVEPIKHKIQIRLLGPKGAIFDSLKAFNDYLTYNEDISIED